MKPLKNNCIFKIGMLIIIIMSIFILAYLSICNKTQTPSANLDTPEIYKNNETEVAVPVQSESVIPEQKTVVKYEVPENYLLEVPFTSQAPLSIWDADHEDACEEASIIMLKHWLKDELIPSKEAADNDIMSLISYESSMGYSLSINLSKLAIIAKDYYKINNISVKEVSSYQEIKTVLASGSPVIIGAAGKLLQNPNFRNGGPNYHMLLIKGYNKDGFVTNDPGTRKGESYFYPNEILFSAIHDWNSSNILLGKTNILYLANP